MPANGRGDLLKADSTESATENIPLGIKVLWPGFQVRVKRCGKSAPRAERSVPAGQTPCGARPNRGGGAARSVRLPGRSLEPDSNVWPRGMIAALRGTETGLQSSRPFRSGLLGYGEEAIDANSGFCQERSQSPASYVRMIWHGKGRDVARLCQNQVTSFLPCDLPTQTFERANYLTRPQQRHRRHQTGTSISRIETVSGKPFWERTSRHSLIASARFA